MIEILVGLGVLLGILWAACGAVGVLIGMFTSWWSRVIALFPLTVLVLVLVIGYAYSLGRAVLNV